MSPLLTSVRCKIGDFVYEPVEVAQLRKLPGFMLSTPVAPIESEHWTPAFQVIDLATYFGRSKPATEAHLDSGLGKALEMLSTTAPEKRSIELTQPKPLVKPPTLPQPTSHSKLKWLMSMLFLMGVTAYAGMTWMQSRTAIPAPVAAAIPEPPIEPLISAFPTPVAVLPPALVDSPKKPAASVSKHHRASHKHHKKHHHSTN